MNSTISDHSQCWWSCNCYGSWKPGMNKGWQDIEENRIWANPVTQLQLQAASIAVASTGLIIGSNACQESAITCVEPVEASAALVFCPLWLALCYRFSLLGGTVLLQPAESYSIFILMQDEVVVELPLNETKTTQRDGWRMPACNFP